MRILHVTPHLPPDQAANALLPWQLGAWAREARRQGRLRGPSAARRQPRGASRPGDVGAAARRRVSSIGRFASARCCGARRIREALAPAIARADVVHVHSNGLLAEAGGPARAPGATAGRADAVRHRDLALPPKRFGPDLFTRAYNAASIVTFYSERLLGRARELGLTSAPHARRSTRRWALRSPGTTSRRRPRPARRSASPTVTCCVNVKRLHPLAGQRYLIEAMNDVVRVHPDTRLVICGTGPLLEELRAAARSAGVERHVTFAGLVDNAVVAHATARPQICSCCRRCSKRCRPSRSRRSRRHAGDLDRQSWRARAERRLRRRCAVVPREQPIAAGRARSPTSCETSAGRPPPRRDHRARVPRRLRWRPQYPRTRTRARDRRRRAMSRAVGPHPGCRPARRGRRRRRLALVYGARSRRCDDRLR